MMNKAKMAQDKSIIQEYESDDELAPSIEELDNKNDKAIIDELIPLFLQSITKMYMESNK